MNIELIREKLPISKDDHGKKLRNDLFMQFDPNSNGFLSLAEVDKGIHDILNLDELYHAKPAIIRAFKAAQDCVKSKNSHGKDFVERSEFRLLLVYLL